MTSQTEIITSVQNPKLRHLRKLLGSSKYRQAENLAVAEGAHLLTSMLAAKVIPELVVYAESALENSEISQFRSKPLENEPQHLVVKDSLFDSISDIHSRVGVLAVFRPARPVAPEKITSDAILLEAVQDPGNLGTILRTAAAGGVGRVYLSPGSASAWSPKSLRSGMGAQFSLDIYETVDLVALTEQASVPVIATAIESDSQDLYTMVLAEPRAWVFGSEGQGVSPELVKACSGTVRIPQHKNSVESLNVSAAAAVCLFEQLRQRRVLQ